MSSQPQLFPSVGQAAAILIAQFLLQNLVSAAFYDLRQTLELSLMQAWALDMVLANGIVLAVVVHLRGVTYRNVLHPSGASVGATAAMLLPPVLMLVPLITLAGGMLEAFLEYVFPLSAWERRAFEEMVSGDLASVVAACVLAPVLEEMLFRGVLLRGFLARYPRWLAIGYSALLFGAAHLNVYQFVYAFLLGLLLGWLFERSRSLIPCIALHAAMNSVAVALGTVYDDVPEDDLVSTLLPAWPLALVLAAVGMAWLRRLLIHAGRREDGQVPGRRDPA